MIFILKPAEFLKAMTHKYIRRWKGKTGEWEYLYPGDVNNRRKVAAEKESSGDRKGQVRLLSSGSKMAKVDDARRQEVEKENVTSSHAGTLKGVTDKHVKELMKHYARRSKGMGKEKVIRTKEDLNIILTRTTFAMMSAGRNPNNPDDMKLTDAQVKARHGKLLERLKDEGFIFTQCHGKYVNPEESVMVMMHDADRETAMALGSEFNQDSIVFTTKGKNELIYTTGEKKGKANMAGDGFEEVPKATDFYTKMPLGTGETVKFTLMLDDVEKALMEMAGIMGIPRYRLFLFKAKKMPIGTVSHGRKKVAEGDWREIPKGKGKAVATIRPVDLKQIKTVAQDIAERTFDANDSTVQPYANAELMAAIKTHKGKYGDQAEGILLQEYARRYNKLNSTLRSEGDSFKEKRRATGTAKATDTKYVVWGYAPGQDYENLLVSEAVDVNDSNRAAIQKKLESMGVTKIRFSKLEPLDDASSVGAMFAGSVRRG